MAMQIGERQMATDIPDQLKYEELYIEDQDDVIFSEPLPPGSQILLFDVENDQSVERWSDTDCNGVVVAGSIVLDEWESWEGTTIRLPIS